MKLCAFVVSSMMLGFLHPAQAQDASKGGEDLGKRWVAAYDAGDAAGIAALFTKDGVFIPPTGVVLKGREAIEKAVAGRMKAGWTKETVTNVRGGEAGNAAWAIGDYELIGSGKIKENRSPGNSARHSYTTATGGIF